jgi:hypothetical protein
MQGVGDEHGSDRCSADGDQFRRLDQDAEIAMLHQKAADDAAENYDNADNGKHILLD